MNFCLPVLEVSLNYDWKSSFQCFNVLASAGGMSISSLLVIWKSCSSSLKCGRACKNSDKRHYIYVYE